MYATTTSLMSIARQVILAALVMALAVHAQDYSGIGSMPFWSGIGMNGPLPGIGSGSSGSGSSGSGSGSGSDSGSVTGSGTGSGSGPSTGSSDPGPDSGPDSSPAVSGASTGFDFSEAMTARAIHGILAATAMVACFPTGAILMRLLGGRNGFFAHAVLQILGIVFYIAAVGMGIHLALEVRDIGVDFLLDPRINYHAIIGLVVLGCMLVQPLLGLMHHERFKKTGRRQVWSYLHLSIGRLAMTAGMANGAVGLWMARATHTVKAMYVGGAIGMWCIWMLVGAWHEWHIWSWRLSTSQARDTERQLEIEQPSASEEGQDEEVKDTEDGHVRHVDATV
ncbi:hypothetical protein C8A05DRAFT_32261 [Staphylotrichum tortipilum]|uniref:Cytochrome b561 domain-containing protein n=1 Tax=Staphylotrichum tortipilum TaxID=2831512 RepID=A0AAN6RUZ4_9PEZI|nr:hypothetical protein C8A05DRAFT_32261 [Staphylotrichum longicolle]